MRCTATLMHNVNDDAGYCGLIVFRSTVIVWIRLRSQFLHCSGCIVLVVVSETYRTLAFECAHHIVYLSHTVVARRIVFLRVF